MKNPFKIKTARSKVKTSEFAERVRASRKACCMSQQVLAGKMGVVRTVITSYETSKALPSMTAFVLLCKHLKVSPDYLLGYDGKL